MTPAVFLSLDPSPRLSIEVVEYPLASDLRALRALALDDAPFDVQLAARWLQGPRSSTVAITNPITLSPCHPVTPHTTHVT